MGSGIWSMTTTRDGYWTWIWSVRHYGLKQKVDQVEQKVEQKVDQQSALLVLFERFDNIGSVDVKIDGSVLERKSFFKMLKLYFSSKLDWISYIISIAKTGSKKIWALVCYVRTLSPEFVLYLHVSQLNENALANILLFSDLKKSASENTTRFCLLS